MSQEDVMYVIDELPEPPFDFSGDDPLLGTDKLTNAMAWIVNALQSQQRKLVLHSGQIESLGAGSAIRDSVPEDKPLSQEEALTSTGGSLNKSISGPRGSVLMAARNSMKDELLVMQLQNVKHELACLPRSEDIERVRKSSLDELATHADKIGERMSALDERLSQSMAAATAKLHDQLTRIADELLPSLLEPIEERLTALEEAGQPDGARDGEASASVAKEEKTKEQKEEKTEEQKQEKTKEQKEEKTEEQKQEKTEEQKEEKKEVEKKEEEVAATAEEVQEKQEEEKKNEEVKTEVEVKKDTVAREDEAEKKTQEKVVQEVAQPVVDLDALAAAAADRLAAQLQELKDRLTATEKSSKTAGELAQQALAAVLASAQRGGEQEREGGADMDALASAAAAQAAAQAAALEEMRKSQEAADKRAAEADARTAAALAAAEKSASGTAAAKTNSVKDVSNVAPVTTGGGVKDVEEGLLRLRSSLIEIDEKLTIEVSGRLQLNKVIEDLRKECMDGIARASAASANAGSRAQTPNVTNVTVAAPVADNKPAPAEIRPAQAERPPAEKVDAPTPAPGAAAPAPVATTPAPVEPTSNDSGDRALAAIEQLRIEVEDLTKAFAALSRAALSSAGSALAKRKPEEPEFPPSRNRSKEPTPESQTPPADDPGGTPSPAVEPSPAAPSVQPDDVVEDAAVVADDMAEGGTGSSSAVNELAPLRGRVERLEKMLSDLRDQLNWQRPASQASSVPRPASQPSRPDTAEVQRPPTTSDGQSKAEDMDASTFPGKEALDELQKDLTKKLELLENRMSKTESKVNRAPSKGEPGAKWSDVQQELERFRQLFEFVQRVLPKDEAEAMKFFKQGGGDSPGTISHGVEKVELDQHRERLEQEVARNAASLKDEFQNLSQALRGMQKEHENSGGRVADLLRRVAKLEKEPRASSKATVSRPQTSDDPDVDIATITGPATTEGVGHSAIMTMPGETSGTPVPFVSRGALKQGIETLREEIRNWLDVLHGSVLQALHQKADSEQLTNLANKVAQMLAGGASTESVAAFAKRSLIGKCASCDAAINADTSMFKKPNPLAVQSQFPANGAPGARVAIRPPDNAALRPPQQLTNPTQQQPGKLPNIAELRGNNAKGLPKGRVLRNPSAPELRGLSTSEDAPPESLG